jgi:site-specific recombinase XerC
MRKRNNVEGLRPDGQKAERGWKAKFEAVLAEHGGTRVNGATASERTKEHNATVVFGSLHVWHEELTPPMRIEEPRNLTDKHIRALVRYWYQEGKKPKTMTGDLSVWRKFGGWIGKPNLVLKLADYLPDVPAEDLVAPATATKSKSWSESGIDVQAKIDEAFRMDHRFGLMLMVQLVFGLRMQEALCLKPHKADHGNGLKVYGSDGPKGSRERFLEIEHDEQRIVLDALKKFTTVRGRLGWDKTGHGKPATLESNIQHYYYCLRKIGITKKNADVCGHGLRAEFAENCAIALGLLPATLGGTADQMPKEEMDRILLRVSEKLGHSRRQITYAYYGKFAEVRADKIAEGAAKKKAAPHALPAADKSDVAVLEDPAEKVATESNAKPAVSSEQPGGTAQSAARNTDAAEGRNTSTSSERPVGSGKSKVLDDRQGKLPLDDLLSRINRRRKK